MNSSDFSVNAADESPADVFASFECGSAASFELLNPVPLPSGILAASLVVSASFTL